MNVETFAQALAERLPAGTKVTHVVSDGIVTFFATTQRNSNVGGDTNNRELRCSLKVADISDFYDPGALLSIAVSHLGTPLADEVPGSLVLDSPPAGSNQPMQASPQPHPNAATDPVPSLNDETLEQANEKVRLAQLPDKPKKVIDEPLRVGHVIEPDEPVAEVKPTRRTRVKPL